MCLNHKSESRCKYGDKCKFVHTEAGGESSEKLRKRVEKGYVHDSPAEKTVYWDKMS